MWPFAISVKISQVLFEIWHLEHQNFGEIGTGRLDLRLEGVLRVEADFI